MPRTRIDLGLALERLSILDEEGKVDATLDPGIPPEELRRLYRFLLLVRAYDERRLRLQRQGRIGTFAPVEGQEAAQLGSVYAIEGTDWVVPSFRELAVALWRGAKMEHDLLFCAGFDEGLAIPSDARDLPISIPVASQIPHAVGLAWGLKLQRSDRIVLCYFGDGATSEGDFHEALNFASLHQVPLVLFCQNNQWAISVPRKEQTRSRTLAQKAFAYDLPALVVDGNDLLAVIAATREAVLRARQGRGPTLIEAVTYRMGVHTTADDPTLYRSQAEVEEWRRRDPLARLRTYLGERGLVGDEEEAGWVEEARGKVDEAVRRFEALASEADPMRMFDHLLHFLPPHLKEEQAILEQRIPRRRPPPARPEGKGDEEQDGRERAEEPSEEAEAPAAEPEEDRPKDRRSRRTRNKSAGGKPAPTPTDAQPPADATKEEEQP